MFNLKVRIHQRNTEESFVAIICCALFRNLETYVNTKLIHFLSTQKQHILDLFLFCLNYVREQIVSTKATSMLFKMYDDDEVVLAVCYGEKERKEDRWTYL